MYKKELLNKLVETEKTLFYTEWLLEDKKERIDKAIEYIKDHYNLATKEEGVAFFILRDRLLEILGDKENGRND